jgi:MoaA/NifB/PqqE/SkfB family radical SAM enzyme
MTVEEELYASNLKLNRAEFALRRIHLTSMPRYLSIVIGTRCNINCPYCYQVKSGEDLLAPQFFGAHLRRELAAFYPYLSTLRIQGGEVFLIPGFEEFVAEVSACVSRPVISISTNGTLIDDIWAEKIVGIPFKEVTFSIDGATPETYERLRRGASLKEVLANVRRIQDLKTRQKSDLPDVNFFFLVMRSTYREIPLFLQLAKDHGVERVSFQMLLVDERNLSREPKLAAEVDFDQGEVRELYDLTRSAIEGRRGQFRSINVCGFQSLFESHNLETGFLDEGRFSFYPDNEAGNLDFTAGTGCNAAAIEDVREKRESGQTTPDDFRLCPNPWTLMYVTETGAVHICFMATPVGNLYETPLISLWNSPKALAARSAMINGCYGAAGCSKLWCSWREGKTRDQPAQVAILDLIREFKRLSQNAVRAPAPDSELIGSGGIPTAIRRILTERAQRIAELEWNLVTLCEKNQDMLETADKQNQSLAQRVRELERVLHFTSGENVQLASEARFGRSYLTKLVKKSAIGGAIRSIQTLDWAGNKLRKFVNWICVR